MTITLQGKGFFINNLTECEGGDPAAIALAAKDAGLLFVVLKIAEETRGCGIDPQGNDLNAPVVRALQGAGISAWGWHYVRGNDPIGEARVAGERVQELGLQGYVINAESEYEQPGREAVTRRFILALHQGVNVPIALCSYHLPKFHPDFPWSAFLEGCDLHMPKVFWELAHNAGEQLRESVRQCEALPGARPYIPIGAAYRTTAWSPLPRDVVDFTETAQSLSLSAVGFFPWDGCQRYLPKIWETVARIPYPVFKPPEQPAEKFPGAFLEALNSRQAERMTACYDPAATLIWGNKSAQGPGAIQKMFAALFARLAEGVTFRLVLASLSQGNPCFTWEAGSLRGETTLVLRDGKILQDYTFITT